MPSHGGPTQPCVSPLTYNVQTTNNGQHQFAVEAVDAAGNISQSISYSWKVAAGSPAEFIINGSVTGLRSPEHEAGAVDDDQPEHVAIFVTQLTFAVSANAGSGSCIASSYTVTPWNSNPPPRLICSPGERHRFVVPLANQPSINADQLGGNQDNCKGKSFTLTYTGSAHS